MYYVYLLRSLSFPHKKYVGFTKDLEQRISCHNSGGSVHTSRYKPWYLEIYFAFPEEKTALNFEKYLKSQAGRAWAKKRLW